MVLGRCHHRHTLDLAEKKGLIVSPFDLGEVGSGSVFADFHELIAERYERAATIVTSNLDFDEWADAFPNKILGAATIDRLRHGAHKIVLDGDSYRSPRPTEEAPKPTVAKRPKKH